MKTTAKTESVFSGLSDQQSAVIHWVLEGSGSLELMARAGCGKTFTLMRVVRTIVENNLGECVLMAYNKKIADEIKFKLEEAKFDWKKAQAGTVHSLGFSAWRRMAPNVQVDARKMETIVAELRNNGDQVAQNYPEVIVKLCGYAKQRAIGHLCPINSQAAWASIWEHFALDNDVEDGCDVDAIFIAAMKAYKISLDRCKDVIDYDDMILAPLYFRARFWQKDWVLVDESQDTNPARRALALAMLKPKTGRMIFVGDDMQAIYGFTGADSDSMACLKAATNAKTLPLNVTRRCPKSVVALAQSIVPDFVAHESAIDGVVRAIKFANLDKEELGKEDAILCRNTAPLITTAYALISKGIACRVEGREIGTGLLKLARRWKIATLDALSKKLDDYESRQTAKFMSKGQEDRVQNVVDQVECLRVVIDRCLVAGKTQISDLVESVTNMFGDTPDGQQPRVLTLSTCHKSKGREWRRVFILGRQKYMPSPYAKQEWQAIQEKNLEYVAITRAMVELVDVEMPAGK
jgi:DNA helicase-2/ATP-dependent DNA helicase PcrA